MVPFFDLEKQTEALREEIHAAVDAVLDSRQFVLGNHVSRFEEEFAACCGVRHAIALNSGTSALHLALLAVGVGPGDEVITVPFTFAATVAAIHYCGAKPVFADIQPKTCNMDVSHVRNLITDRTRAILPVHLYGLCADVNALRSCGLPVIEDAAQAHLSESEGRRAGSLGNLGCFSFYPTKNLGACGEGGAVTTDDDELAGKVRLLRDWGQDRKYHHAMRGYNYRMEGITGAVLSAKLKYLAAWTRARRSIAARYGTALEGASITLPVHTPGHVYHTYTVRCEQRDSLREHLTNRGIGTAVHYPIPLHLQPAYADQRWPEGSLPHAERAAKEVLSLPIYPEMPMEHVDEVAAAIHAFL